MLERLVDFSFSHPRPAVLRAAGVEGVLRYLALDRAKAISVAEASQLHAAGLPYGLVYEDGPMDFAGGANAGGAKAAVAAPILAALTRAELWAPDRPVHCAVDGNLPTSLYRLTWEGIHAFAQLLERPEACYGPRPYLYWLEQNHGVRFLWESGSASYNTGPEPTKTLQHLVTVPPGCKPVSGVDWDLALVPDWGQFPAPAAPQSTEDDVILTHLHDGQAVAVFPAQSGYRPLGPEMQAWLLSAGYKWRPPLPQNPPLKNLGAFSA